MQRFLKYSVPIRFIDKWPVGGTPTGATETVALPGTEKLSVNRIGMKYSLIRKRIISNDAKTQESPATPA